MDDTQDCEPAGHDRLLQLPKEILLQILSYFAKPASQRHEATRWRYPQEQRPSDLTSLQNARLACRRLDEVVSPLVCPVVTVALDSRSIRRADMLLRDPLIASGVRGFEINLRYRPSSLATDLRRYHAQIVKSIVDEAARECDWHTEFQFFEDEDESPDATEYRAYVEADRELGDENLVRANQTMLEECFSSYAAKHHDQVRIISDSSFVRTLVEVISRLKNPPFVWFTDQDHQKYNPDRSVLELAQNRVSLRQQMEAARDWLEIERLPDVDEVDLLPARVLTDLPIACHKAAVQLRGLSIGCFPLTKGFEQLLPVGTMTVADDTGRWAEFSAACQNFSIFHFGLTGMACTPLRPSDFMPSHRMLIDAFLGAACSGPHLQRVCLSMTPLRRTAASAPDLHYRADSILARLTSTQVLDLQLLSIQISGDRVADAIGRLSSSARYVYLSSITLEQGRYAGAMAALRKRVAEGQHLQVELNSLKGAEFGPATKFQEVGAMGLLLDEESSEKYWDRLEDHMHPMLLKRTLEWVRNEHGHANPLVDPAGTLKIVAF